MKPQHGFSIFRATLVAAVLTAPAALAADPGIGLKDAYKDRFLIGTAADLLPDAFNATEIANIKNTFNVVTPENYMKPGAIHPTEDTYSFARPDAMVDWCLANNIKVHGHTLVWHAQTGNWFFAGNDKAVITKRLQDHIKTVVGHYKGKVHSWDVINESIEGNQPNSENLRAGSPWIRALGPELFGIAFRAAREADPNAILYYNDYNNEVGQKLQSTLMLVKRLKAEGVPIDGVGIQGHWSTRGLPFDAIDNAIAAYAELGMKVSVSELDVTIDGSTGGELGGRGPRGGAPANLSPVAALLNTLQYSVADLSDDQKAKLSAAAPENLAEAEIKFLSILTPNQAAKWESARLKAMLNGAFNSIAFSDAQAGNAAPIIDAASKTLAAAKDVAALTKAKADFWNKSAALLSDLQLAQLLAPTFPAGGGRGGMGMGGARGNRGGATVAPAAPAQPLASLDSINASITDLTEDQKTKLSAINDDLSAKLRDWQAASQRAMAFVQPQYSAGQVSYDYEIKLQRAEQFKQNSLREDLINDAEIKMVAVLTPDQAKKWQSTRLNSQATAAFAAFGGAVKFDNILADAANKLAAAKDKPAVSAAKSEFWKKALVLLDDDQTVQLFGAKAGNINIPNPNAGIATAEALQRQAQAYARLFGIFEKHKKSIERITFWGLNDARSWRPGQAALLFDVNNNRKPAYDAILDVVLNPKN